jgi:hypothetical protein
MRVLCAFCFYHTEVDEEDTSTVCENCQMELMVYEDGTTEVLTDGVIE